MQRGDIALVTGTTKLRFTKNDNGQFLLSDEGTILPFTTENWKQWRILSFKEGNIIFGRLGGTFHYQNHPKGFQDNEIIEMGVPIYSVIRLSDNVIFNVGDTFKEKVDLRFPRGDEWTGEIERFEVDGSVMMVWLKNNPGKALNILNIQKTSLSETRNIKPNATEDILDELDQIYINVHGNKSKNPYLGYIDCLEAERRAFNLAIDKIVELEYMFSQGIGFVRTQDILKLKL